MLQKQPALQGLPKAKEKEGNSTVDREIWPIFYLAARSDISIKGQRG
jgi:hypothetical protein